MNRRAATLIEIIITIILVSVLAVTILVGFSGSAFMSREASKTYIIEEYNAALDQWVTHRLAERSDYFNRVYTSGPFVDVLDFYDQGNGAAAGADSIWFAQWYTHMKGDDLLPSPPGDETVGLTLEVEVGRNRAKCRKRP